jgi:hypothetical protein
VIGVLCCCGSSTAFEEAPAADRAESERSYPSLPGAVRECPEWLKKHTPFDIVKWFEVVPPEENAASLYLDALYEFAPQDMEYCLAPLEVESRGPTIRNRAGRTNAAMRKELPALSSELVDEYADAFEKLAQAQKRKRCVFETGIGIDAQLPHLQASKAAGRVLDWRVEFAVVNGRIDEAINDVRMGLPLSRDLRPRGSIKTSAGAVRSTRSFSIRSSRRFSAPRSSRSRNATVCCKSSHDIPMKLLIPCR